MSLDEQQNSMPLTFICDASTLIGMNTQIPKEAKKDPQSAIPRFLNILEWLAANGVQVVIPEMVAYEAASILKGGVDIDSFFSNHREFSKEHYSSAEQLKKWIGNVARGKIPNISLEAVSGPEKVMDYIESLGEVANNPLPNRDDTRQKIMHIQRQPRKNFGDDSILHLLDEQYREQTNCKGNPQVFLLTEDTGLIRRAARNHPQLGIANVAGLLQAVDHNRLQGELGLKEDVAITRLNEQRIHSILDQRTRTKYRYEPTAINNTAGDYTEWKHLRKPLSFALSQIRHSEEFKSWENLHPPKQNGQAHEENGHYTRRIHPGGSFTSLIAHSPAPDRGL